MTTARDVMNRGVQCIAEYQTLFDAASYMKNLGIGCLPIQSSDGSLVGMVTDRDIVIKCVAEGADPAGTAAGTLATGEVQTVAAATEIGDVLSVMRHHQVKRLPVLSDGTLVGMISESDLVAALSPDEVASFAEGVYKRD